MQKISTANEWGARAYAALPAGGFGNFDPGVILERGEGSRVWDVEGREFIDYLIGSGPMMLGHGHPEVNEAILEQLPKGLTFFANNTAGVELAEAIIAAVPCAEQVRFLTSGGEADMYAIRLARAATGRPKILKFEGGYHGMGPDAQMSLAPTRLVNFPQAVPDSAGIPDGVRENMLVAPFNDIEMVRSLIAEHGPEIAGIIVEPLQRLIPPEPGFLAALREECTKAGIILIFDEIVTGFRLAWGGAQEAYGVVPDICTLGKVIGGGFALAAIAGRADLMAHFDKSKANDNFLMQLGTLAGAPMAAVAGLKTMEILSREGTYDRLEANGKRIMASLETHLGVTGHPFRIVGAPSLFDVIFIDRDVRDYRDSIAGDAGLNARFNDVLRAEGIMKPIGKTYISLALSDEDLDRTDAAIKKAAEAL